uniref:FAM194 C-terminal domain-containing protein n=1 Tax=Globisporangium ultimum (strain ATCC 200006 / CBS 805.95 / DAOM BR144) TaxID=431595 RepID=K3XA95_GLOUD
MGALGTLVPPAASSGENLAQESNYPTGEPAIRLDAFGCGFGFYLSGRVAVCANKVSEYQRSFQFYEDNTKKSLLGTLDEHAIGSVGHPHRKKLILTKDCGIIMDANNIITKTWRWDPKAQHAGSPPSEPVMIQLNDSLVFTYRDRTAISVTFKLYPGIAVDFACGEQLRRTDTYLEHSHRVMSGPQRGKLLIDQSTPTLQQRQKRIELESIEKRSKQKPRSTDLSHDQLKGIVANLESKFDGYDGCRVTPAVNGNWKEHAHAQCLREIPILPKTGFEVGHEPTLFGAPVKKNDASESLKRLQNRETGKWLDSVEIHHKIALENPVLRRSGPLTSASGRYSRELSVQGGGVKPTGEHLRLISACKLDEFLKEKCVNEQLVVLACLRSDDCQSRVVEAMLEQVQQQIRDSAMSPALSQLSGIRQKCCLVKCDLGESPVLAERYRIHATPTFLMFYDQRLVHVTSMGGAAMRVFPATKNAHLSGQMDYLPRALLVEKNVKQQIAIEKVLKKEAFQWDLANHGEQAVSYFTRLPRNTNGTTATGKGAITAGYGIVLLSDTLDDFEVRSIDRCVRQKDKARPSESLVCVVVSSPLVDVSFASGMCSECRRAHGRRIRSESPSRKRDAPLLACPHCGILSAESMTSVVPAVLADVGQIFVYKNVKAATMHRLAERWSIALQGQRSGASSLTSSSSSRSFPPTSNSSSQRGDGDSFVGLTVDSFFKEIERHWAAGKRGLFLPEHHVPGMALSAIETVLANQANDSENGGGRGLVRSVLRSVSA